MDELLDIFDEQGNQIGTAPRSRVHREGLLHQVTHCWILAENEPVLYMQQRAWNKADFAGCYDIACGGHIAAGEAPVTAMRRELFEELGLMVEEAQLISLGSYRAPDLQLPNYYDRTFAQVFLLRMDDPSFRTGAEVKRMVRISTSDFCAMECEKMQQIPVQTMDGHTILTEYKHWCCHDGEFFARVFPRLQNAHFTSD